MTFYKLLFLSLILLLVKSELTLTNLQTNIKPTSLQKLGLSPINFPTPTNTVHQQISVRKAQQITPKCGEYEVTNHESICIKPEYIQGCQIYETHNTCHKCFNGYDLSSEKRCNYNSLSSQKINHILGCILAENPSSCSVCAEGFYKKDGKCKKGIKNCIQYDQDGQCLNCKTDYSLILSQCRHNYILGCKFQAQKHVCSQCYQPFVLNGSHCDIQNCLTLNDFGCISCECGFYLTADKVCQPIKQGCLRYQRGVCTNCLGHYKLKGGVCQIQGCQKYSGNYCRKCRSDYELVEGECHFKNCVNWLEGQCLVCQQNFAVSHGKCQPTEKLNCQ